MTVAKFSLMECDMMPGVGWCIIHLEEKREKVTIMRNDDSTLSGLTTLEVLTPSVKAA